MREYYVCMPYINVKVDNNVYAIVLYACMSYEPCMHDFVKICMMCVFIVLLCYGNKYV